MAIDGFDFTTISDGRVDPDSPLDTTLTTDYRDNSEFLMRWLGKSFLGAAVADHDHDGSNSKQIDVGDIIGVIGRFVWIDDNTQVFTASGPVGLISISSQVPVDTVFAQIYMENVTESSGGQRRVQFRQPGSGTYQNMYSTSGYDAARLVSGTALVPVNSSRQIDIAFFGTGANGEVRSYQK